MVEPVAMAGRRVLVVEDEWLVSLSIEDALRDVGCEIVGPVSRVPTALAMAETETLDAAVLDVNLAGALVFPVAEALRARNVPFIFLTGYASSLSVDETILAKPFKTATLQAAVTALLLKSA